MIRKMFATAGLSALMIFGGASVATAATPIGETTTTHTVTTTTRTDGGSKVSTKDATKVCTGKGATKTCKTNTRTVTVSKSAKGTVTRTVTVTVTVTKAGKVVSQTKTTSK